MQRQTISTWALAVAAGLLGTVQYHLAQFRSGFDTFVGDRGDPRFITSLCEHWYQTLGGNASLLSPRFFYPVRGTLASSDLLVGLAIPYAALRSLGFEMFLSMEIVVITFTFLAYLTCFLLLYRVLGFHLLAAIAASMFFAFSSPRFLQLPHLQLQFVFLLPLIFILVIRFAQGEDRLSQQRAFFLLAGAGLLFDLLLLTTFYFAWFFSVWAVLFVILALLFSRSRKFLAELFIRFWRAITAAAAVSIFGAMPFLIIYLPNAGPENWYTYENVKAMIPSWWTLLYVGDGNYLWGWLTRFVRPQPLPEYWNELGIGVGVVTSLAWIAITVYAARFVAQNWRGNKGDSDLRTNGLFFAALLSLSTTLFYLIGMQYFGYSPWRLVYELFPGARAVRAMARYAIFLALPMSIGFALLIDRLLNRASHKSAGSARQLATIGVVLFSSLIVVEQFGVFKLGGQGFSRKAENLYLKTLAEKIQPDCEAFYLAVPPHAKYSDAEYQYDAMVLAAMTRVPTLNGSSSQFPPNWFGLYRVQDPAYEQHVKAWVDLNQLKGKICRVEVTVPLGAFDPSAPHPLDDPSYFVRQQFRDVEQHEPTATELSEWTTRVEACKSDSLCRAGVAMELLRSSQFYRNAITVLRLYEMGLGRVPTYTEFTADVKALQTGQSENSRMKFVEAFMERPDFTSRHAGLSDTDFQIKLYETIQIPSFSLAPREQQMSRTELVLRIIDGEDVKRFLEPREWIMLHYFVYLRRDPDVGGYEAWTGMLENTRDFQRVTDGFVNSTEYRLRVLQKP